MYYTMSNTENTMRYVVYFDDGTMLGKAANGMKRYVREFPDALLFSSKRAAEAAVRYMNKPHTVEPVEAAS